MDWFFFFFFFVIYTTNVRFVLESIVHGEYNIIHLWFINIFLKKTNFDINLVLK